MNGKIQEMTPVLLFLSKAYMKYHTLFNGCVSFQLKAMAEPVEAGADYATTTSTGSVSVTIPTHLKHTTI